jgi:hypothetical protein
MDNPEIQETLGTQDTLLRQTKQKPQHRKLKQKDQQQRPHQTPGLISL